MIGKYWQLAKQNKGMRLCVAINSAITLWKKPVMLEYFFPWSKSLGFWLTQ